MIRYYDWAGTTGCGWAVSGTTGAAAYTSAAFTSCTGTAAYAPVYWVIRREILVDPPDHWTDEGDVLPFVHLLNGETKTGWKVSMLISGDVLVTDPNVEHRTMAAFKPLLCAGASKDDLAKILAFFEAHPIDPPADDQQPGSEDSEGTPHE